ncbi:MAG: DUF4255 domain-containing protein [Chloroflexi bacterium]|nr:MAG: DUF4255 domain-containing protein [Chloroflexota bacterium]
MISDLDRTIENILTDEIPIQNGEIDIKFDQPTREWSARLSRPTINLFLYDLRENNVLRQHQWERMMEANGNSHTHDISQKRTPFRIDCHYMLTAWAADPQDEHRLLTRAMLALFRFPILTPRQLTGELENQPFKLQTRLASHDKLTNPAELWGSMDNEMRPSISYIVTLALDPWKAVSGPAVRTYTLDTGQAESLPDLHRLEEGTAVTNATIGGIITKSKEAQSGLQVTIKATGQSTVTDKNGRFILGALPYGSHTLVVWSSDGKPKEKEITVPDDNYDVEI